jgi:hypothetical protein
MQGAQIGRTHRVGELFVVFVELNHFLSQPNGRVLEKSASSLFSTPVGLENL